MLSSKIHFKIDLVFHRDSPELLYRITNPISRRNPFSCRFLMIKATFKHLNSISRVYVIYDRRCIVPIVFFADILLSPYAFSDIYIQCDQSQQSKTLVIWIQFENIAKERFATRSSIRRSLRELNWARDIFGSNSYRT